MKRKRHKTVAYTFVSVCNLFVVSSMWQFPSHQIAAQLEETQAPSQARYRRSQVLDFYKGKSIEMLVPFGAGGGSDVTARFMAPFYNKYLEGNPSVQVVNVPGGGSVIGANEFVNLREPNGEYALWTSGSTVYPYLLGEPAVQFELKELEPIIAIPLVE